LTIRRFFIDYLKNKSREVLLGPVLAFFPSGIIEEFWKKKHSMTKSSVVIETLTKIVPL